MGRRAKKKARPAVRSKYLKGTAFDRIKYFYLEKIPENCLTEKEKEMIWRFENIWGLYQKHLKSSIAIKHHVKTCEIKGYKIDERTAWRDFRDANKIWGKNARVNKQAKLVLLDEATTDIYLKAKEKKSLTQMNKAINNLLKINKQVEDQLEDSREPHTYELHIHLNSEKRTLDLNKLPFNNAAYKKVLENLEGREMDDDTCAKLIDESED